MRKKILFIAAGFVLTLLVALVVLPMTFRRTREVDIPVVIYDVAPQLTDLRNWKNWYPDTAIRGLVVTASNPAGIAVKKGDRPMALAALSVGDGRHTRVRWTCPETVAEWIKGKGPEKDMEKGLARLKGYFEDPSRLYGFAIHIQPVKDTLILTKRAVVAASPETVRAQWVVLEKELMDYLATLGRLPGVLDVYWGTEPVRSDSTEVVVGIPVPVRGPVKAGVEYLKLPANGRLLVGQFPGPDSVMPALYSAMDKYVLDKGLHKVAVPFEVRHVKLFENQEPGSRVHELVYPIY